ncbi:22062_t:CDS:2 [Rhizophagus irregularis]|nr:22062_t:CDS:2 [Rhizophagus irregularis]
MEYSPWTLDIETIVACSPLGRGFQTGKYKSLDDFEPDDLEEQYHVFKGDDFITILNTRRIKKF